MRGMTHDLPAFLRALGDVGTSPGLRPELEALLLDYVDIERRTIAWLEAVEGLRQCPLHPGGECIEALGMPCAVIYNEPPWTQPEKSHASPIFRTAGLAKLRGRQGRRHVDTAHHRDSFRVRSVLLDLSLRGLVPV